MAALLTILSTLVLVWALGTRRRRAVSSALALEARLALTPRSGLALIAVSGQRLVVSWGEGPPRLVAHLADDAATPTSPSRRGLPIDDEGTP